MSTREWRPPVAAEPERDAAPDILLDERGACRALKCAPRTLYEWREKHGLPYIALGRTIRYPVQQLHEWAARRTRTTGASDGESGGA